MSISPLIYSGIPLVQNAISQLTRFAPLAIATAIMQAYPSLASASESALRNLVNKVSPDNDPSNIQSLFEKALNAENLDDLESSIEKGADVNKLYFGRHPLKWARDFANPEITHALIKNGAKEDLSNIPYQSKTPIANNIEAPSKRGSTLNMILRATGEA